MQNIPKNVEKYKKSGVQTKITPRIEEISEEFSDDGLYFIAYAIRWISENLEKRDKRELKERVFRKRIADEIIRSCFTPLPYSDTFYLSTNFLADSVEDVSTLCYSQSQKSHFGGCEKIQIVLRFEF